MYMYVCRRRESNRVENVKVGDDLDLARVIHDSQRFDASECGHQSITTVHRQTKMIRIFTRASQP